MNQKNRHPFIVAVGLMAVMLTSVHAQRTIAPPGKNRSGKYEKVGVFEDGKGWKKAIPAKKIICTEAQLKAFFKTLGIEPNVKADFAKEYLCVVTKPTWDRNRRFYSSKVDDKGDLTLVIGSTKMGCFKPQKGPYRTEVGLVRASAKGVKSYNGQALEDK